MRLLCVDFGNVCRGPMAEAVLRRRLAGAAGMVVDSAGINIVSAGEAPDPRAIAVAAARGYRLDGIRCRGIEDADFRDFDRLFAVDRYVLDRLRRIIPRGSAARTRLLHPEGSDIADPYEGSLEAFSLALDLIEDAADGIAAQLGRIS